MEAGRTGVMCVEIGRSGVIRIEAGPIGAAWVFGLLICLLMGGCSRGTGDDDTNTLPSAPVLENLLEGHNLVRADHGVATLAWDDTLASKALDWSETLAARGCSMEHSGDEYGENLYWSSINVNESVVVIAWAGEEAYYDYEANTCQAGEMCGHYTQVVWADSKLLGCGRASCSDGGEIWTCKYDPPGNYVGQWPY